MGLRKAGSTSGVLSTRKGMDLLEYESRGGHQDDQRVGAPLLCGKTERNGIEPKEEKDLRGPDSNLIGSPEELWILNPLKCSKSGYLSFEPPGLVTVVPAHGRELELNDL